MSLKVEIVKKLADITLDIVFDTSKTEGITGILGASGCGKSMTLKCIAGIVTPDSGRIVLNDRVLFDSKKGINVKVQDRSVGYLFQNYALFPHMTVLENIEMALSGSKREKREMAEQYLCMFHVENLAKYYPTRLSGGQQQRVALARIMASKPQVLMLDEPFSALDSYLKESLQLELLEELKNYEGDVLFVTHNRDEIYRFCHTIQVINKGSVAVCGGVKEVFDDPQVISAARLTGCKNIVEIRQETSHSFFVPRWGISIIMKNREVPQNADYIGIRAHYLKSSAQADIDNAMECRCNQILEDPFEVTLIFDNGIWWKISRDRWKSEFQEMVPRCIVVPEEIIFFLQNL